MGSHQINNVHLRAMEPEDLDLLYRIENDPDSWGVSTTNVPYSRYFLHDFIAHSSGDIFADKQVRLIVELTDGTPIGLADLMNFDPRHQRAEVGIVLMVKYRRQGYASQVLRLLAEYAMSIVHLHQLYAVIATTNEAAIRLFQGQGYQAALTLSDWLCDGQTYRSALVMQKILSA